MKRLTKRRLQVVRETIIELANVRGGDGAEPTGSVGHPLCNSVGCPRPK